MCFPHCYVAFFVSESLMLCFLMTSSRFCARFLRVAISFLLKLDPLEDSKILSKRSFFSKYFGTKDLSLLRTENRFCLGALQIHLVLSPSAVTSLLRLFSSSPSGNILLEEICYSLEVASFAEDRLPSVEIAHCNSRV